ncbi:stalk domain-containing protein [Tissierella sp.]|uniref:stalk domain-containing protein n=1 Tax=Tissierella sp. TaxID=41274 RepID=UPI002858D117|nr:stalk domain-containing protein [Tissierella sp.]MDR7855050.1 stalk domain-containing protein [Tissierella sp.]
MKKREKYRIVMSYVLALILLSSLVVFPDSAYGRNNAKNMVAIKTFNGLYLCAENGGDGQLVADRENIGEWETFEMIDLGKGYIALKGNNGKYVSVSNDGKDVYVDSSRIDKRQIFQLLKVDSKVAFRIQNKTYLCAEDGGGGKVVGDRETIGEWETFELIKIQDINSDKCNLTAVSNDKNVTFTWTKPANTKNIIGYNLYRGTSPGKQSSTPVTDFPIESTSYTDNNLNSGVTYYYVLKVVYKDKTLGVASNEVSVLLKSATTLSARIEEDGIGLYWTKPTNTKNIIGYNLYRGTASGKQSNIPITDFPIEGTSYIDRNIDNNITYYYTLRAVYRDNTLGELSNEVAIKSNLYNRNIVLEVGSKYMVVNGQRKEIDPGNGTKMVIKNGRTFLPIRAVIESMGGTVEWDQSAKKVSIYLRNKNIQLWIGEKTVVVNGSYMESDVAPYISDSGRTMLPLRFITENLDCKVDWDGTTKKVTIRMDN